MAVQPTLTRYESNRAEENSPSIFKRQLAHHVHQVLREASYDALANRVNDYYENTKPTYNRLLARVKNTNQTPKEALKTVREVNKFIVARAEDINFLKKNYSKAQASRRTITRQALKTSKTFVANCETMIRTLKSHFQSS